MLTFILSILALVLSIGVVQNPQKSPEDIIGQIEEKISSLPAQITPENLPEITPPESTPSASLEQSHGQGNTDKVLTYNSESQRVIGEVPQVAVDHANPLVSCVDYPELCESSISATPTPTPTPTPVPLPDPEPIPDPIHPLPCPVAPGVKPPRSLIGCL